MNACAGGNPVDREQYDLHFCISRLHLFILQAIIETPLFRSTKAIELGGLMIKFVQVFKVLPKTLVGLVHIENPLASLALGRSLELDHILYTSLTHLSITTLLQEIIKWVCDCELVQHP
jgi:hypothetical protein